MSSVSEDRRPAGGYWLDPRAQFAYLRREWRMMFRPGTMLADTMAGAVVALVALPLSLAIAAASGLPPEIGLVTAIVGGIVVALVGGCRLQVSGPGNAIPFLVAEIVAKYQMSGLVVAMMMASFLQILAGGLRLGRFMQLIPRPVVAGFLSGIGLTLFCTQLPVILGYDVTHNEEGGVLAILYETLRQVHRTEFQALAVGLTAMALMLILPRISRKIPTPLVAIILAAALPAAFGWSRVGLLGDLPNTFPSPSLPVVPWGLWNELVMAAIAIFVLVSLESLLSASVVESLSKGTKVDHDQELVGQGMGNLASALFGGLPVTGVIARSGTNIQAGAKTRLAAIVHALLLLLMMFVLSPLVAKIPLAALAGVLGAVAIRMIEVHLLRTLWRSSRPEAVVFITTTGAILATDLIVGVPVGILAAFLFVVYEMSRLEVRTIPLAVEEDTEAVESCPAATLIRVEGPLFFASGFHLRSLTNRLGGHRVVIFDLETVPFLDVTGAEVLEDAVDRLLGRGVVVLLARPTEAVARRLSQVSHELLPALRSCPSYRSLRDALLHAASENRAEDRCGSCRDRGQCAALERALGGFEAVDRTPVPRVRAIVANGDGTAAGVEANETGDGASRKSPARPGRRRAALPVIAPSATIDPSAVVAGDVTLDEQVRVGPGAAVRADAGAPLHVGAGTTLQDGAWLHASGGRVVLVGGRPYGLYVGRDVCLAHHALIHGPSFVGDGCVLGFRASVHDAVIGEGCVLGLGAVVVGVTIPPGRCVGHNQVVDSQEKADALLPVDPVWRRFRDEVVEHPSHEPGPEPTTGEPDAQATTAEADATPA